MADVSVVFIMCCLLPSCLSSPIPIANTSVPLHQGNITGLSFPLYARGPEKGLVFVSATFGTGTNALMTFHAGTGSIADTIDKPRTTKTNLVVQAFGSSAIAGNSERHAIIFTGTAVTAEGTQVDGVFLQLGGSPRVLAIALSGPSFADARIGDFVAFGDVAVAISPGAHSVKVAFQGSKPGGAQGIYTADVGMEELPALAVVADTSTTIPGSGGLKFRCLSSPAVDGHGVVTFFGSHCESSASVMVSRQWARSGMFKKHRWSDHCVTRNMGYPGRSASNHVFPGVFSRVPSGPLTVVASSATMMPGSTKLGFQAFSAPSIGSDGTIAFVALTTGGEGVYAFADGILRSIANVSTPIPNGGVQTFGDFPYTVSVGADGLVIFYADAPLAYSGIYSETKMGGVQAEVTEADAIGGQGIVFIGFGANAYDEASDSFATYLVLSDSTDGVWVFDRIARNTSGNEELELLRKPVAI